MTEETKNEIKVNVIKYWRELSIALLLIILIGVSYYLNEQNKKLLQDINSRKTDSTANGINKPKEEVDKREAEVYPKLDKSLKDLNNNIKALNDKIDKEEKKRPTKEQSYAIFKNKSSSEINSYFNGIGITSTISSDGK